MRMFQIPFKSTSPIIFIILWDPIKTKWWNTSLTTCGSSIGLLRILWTLMRFQWESSCRVRETGPGSFKAKQTPKHKEFRCLSFILTILGQRKHSKWRHILPTGDSSPPGLIRSSGQTRRLQERLPCPRIPFKREAAATKVPWAYFSHKKWILLNIKIIFRL